MTRLGFLITMVLAATAGSCLAQESVEARRLSASIKLEEVIYGHLHELNGKYKMRATEVTFAPGGFLGAHHHVGPGIRFVLSGELAFTEGGQTTIYKAGDYFFETGNLAHTAENKTSEPLKVLFFEVLPKDWDGATIVLPRP